MAVEQELTTRGRRTKDERREATRYKQATTRLLLRAFGDLLDHY